MPTPTPTPSHFGRAGVAPCRQTRRKFRHPLRSGEPQGRFHAARPAAVAAVGEEKVRMAGGADPRDSHPVRGQPRIQEAAAVGVPQIQAGVVRPRRLQHTAGPGRGLLQCRDDRGVDLVATWPDGGSDGAQQVGWSADA